ncbi:TIGR04104 family putative zinc finger protein [Oceanobacillus manasiensis]|uniref:TIGR04104 family putative zinc finger protein n=1 Tax=Oceanobacillus manasiensis TaxID=586413 RepID=UPI0038CD2A96
MHYKRYRGVFLQKCNRCNASFHWGQIYKSFWWSYKPIKCKECGTVHKIRISGRFIFVSLTILPMLIFGYFFSPFNNSFLTLGAAICILIIGSIFALFFVRYKES